MMHPRHPIADLLIEQVYELTHRGKEELNGAATTMTSEQLQLLVRFDGTLTLNQIKNVMPGTTAETFMSSVRDLRDKGLVAEVRTDSLGTELEAQLRRFAQSVSSSEASSEMLSLRKNGYYVEIARGQPLSQRAASDHPLTALVVEDDEILAKFIKTYLSLDGFHVRLAATRAEVVQELNKKPIPDIVLLDVGLPDVDGFDILDRLRQHPRLQHMRIVMLTGRATREAVIKGIQLGADGYITKPFQADALMRAVQTVLGLPVPADVDPWALGDAPIRRKWQVEAGSLH